MQLFRDSHWQPHLMTDTGGCCCPCPLCVSIENGFYRCICPRCSQDCPATGRLGAVESVGRETPYEYGKPAGRWYTAGRHRKTLHPVLRLALLIFVMTTLCVIAGVSIDIVGTR